jgi:DNA-binding transcriptional ArsR family regulator
MAKSTSTTKQPEASATPESAQPAEPRTLRLTSPKQMRALSHPIRLQILGRLRADGPATATALAARLAISVPLVSYHLRQLGDYGFIEEAPELARDERERPWRSSHDQTSWSTAEFLDTPERIAAQAAFTREIVRAYAQDMERWLDEAPTWPAGWVDASEMSDYLLDLTPEELLELRAELTEVLARYRGRGRGEGREQVHAIVNLLPRHRGEP